MIQSQFIQVLKLTKNYNYLNGISKYLEMFEPFSRDAFRNRTSVDMTSVAIFMAARGQPS